MYSSGYNAYYDKAKKRWCIYCYLNGVFKGENIYCSNEREDSDQCRQMNAFREM